MPVALLITAPVLSIERLVKVESDTPFSLGVDIFIISTPLFDFYTYTFVFRSGVIFEYAINDKHINIDIYFNFFILTPYILNLILNKHLNDFE